MVSSDAFPAVFALGLAVIAAGYIVVMLILNQPIVPGERRRAIADPWRE